MSLNCHLGLTIIAGDLNGESIFLFYDLKAGMMMDSGKEPSTNEGVELRRGVTPGNIHPFSICAVLFPLHRNAVSRVLRRETEQAWQRAWSHLFEANEADAGYTHPMNALRSKWSWQKPLEIVGLHTVIQEETPINSACKGRNIHDVPHCLKRRTLENATSDCFIFSLRL